MSAWYRQGEISEVGPFSLEELQYLSVRGQLKPNELIRNAGRSEWVLASSVDSLFANGAVSLADTVRPKQQQLATDVSEAEPTGVDSPPADVAAQKPELPKIRSPQPVARRADRSQVSTDTEDNETWKRVAIGSGIGVAFVLLILLLLLLLLYSGSGLMDTGGQGRGLADATGREDGAGEDGAVERSPRSQGGTPTDAPKVGQNVPKSASEADPDDFKPLPEETVTIERLDVPMKSPNPEATHSGGGGGSGRTGGGSDFFGVRARGNTFVYVVDCSSSMSGPPFQKACEELLTSIDRLRSRQKFYIFFFDSRTYRMFHPDSMEPKLFNASKKNKKLVSEWVSNFQGGGGTSPRDAMLQALDLKPDVIFLLSDGAFRDGTENAVSQKNNQKVMINTIGFRYRSGEDMLKKIAEENRGEYRFVP